MSTLVDSAFFSTIYRHLSHWASHLNTGVPRVLRGHVWASVNTASCSVKSVVVLPTALVLDHLWPAGWVKSGDDQWLDTHSV